MYKTSLDLIQRIFYYFGSIQGRLPCYHPIFICVIPPLLCVRLRKERSWKELNHVVLLEEKLNKHLFTTG